MSSLQQEFMQFQHASELRIKNEELKAQDIQQQLEDQQLQARRNRIRKPSCVKELRTGMETRFDRQKQQLAEQAKLYKFYELSPEIRAEQEKRQVERLAASSTESAVKATPLATPPTQPTYIPFRNANHANEFFQFTSAPTATNNTSQQRTASRQAE